MNNQQIHPKFNREFVDKAINQTVNFLEQTLKGENKVINLKMPEELYKAIDFEVQDEPCTEEDLLQNCESIMQHQTKPYHPHFHNQLYGGFDEYAYIGAVMAPSINGSVYTYEIAPCFTLMENSYFEHMRRLVNWPTMDAMFTPGGSFANFLAVHISRHRIHPEFHKKGLFGCKPMKLFTSDLSHYSLKKAANLCGMGTDNIVYVKTDENRRMIPSDLEKCIEEQLAQGNDLLMVNSTVGTTVEGAIDPITEIGEICKKYKLWHHVDAALGGAFIHSEELIGSCGSFDNVDSITFDPHKGLVVALQVSVFLCKDPHVMATCNSANADYLFHKERASYDGRLDVGDKSLQCGRVIDIFKFWTYLKGNGWKKIAQQVEQEHALAMHIKKFIEENPDKYELIFKNIDTFNVCFSYKPAKMDKKDFANEEEYYELLSKLTVLAKKYMIEEGKIMVGYSKSKTSYYHWRTVMLNPFLSNEDVEMELGLIAKYCEMAYAELTK